MKKDLNPSKSKNIIYQSSIYAEGNIHIGDIYNINGHPSEIPLQLNTLPFIAQSDVIGRDSDLANTHKLLSTSDKVTLVNGLGGIGKTTLAKYFLTSYRDKYNYVAWIYSTSNIKEAFLNNIELLDSLAIRSEVEDLTKGVDWIDNAFSLVINRMRQLGGNQNDKKNLLIIDNVGEDVEHTQTLDQIAMRPNWKVLVTSREKLIGFTEYELGFLSPDDARVLFYKHYTRSTDDKLVKEILDLIDYHTLLIEVISKTAQSLRLDLAELLDRLKKKGLNISSGAKIKFPHNYNQKVFDVFEYLLEMFELANLSEGEKWLMKQFSVLPSFHYPYEKSNNEGVLKLLQVEKEDYRDQITQSLNRIVEKGWLQWDQHADTFKMHNIIQEVLRFKLKASADDCRDLIQEMFSRMSYQKVNFFNKDNQIVKDITRFVTGESIVFAELLDEYASVMLRLYDYPSSIALQERALQMKLKVLPVNDIKIADSYNALALAFLSTGDYENAIDYQLKDLEITRMHTKEDDYNIAITYNNLSLIYRKTKEFDRAIFYQDKAEAIARKLNDPDLDNVVFNNAGNLQYLQKNFPAALKHFEKSLATRLKNNSDELWISEAHANLASALIELSDFKKAKEHLAKAYETEERLVPNTISFADILYWYGVLYFEQREYEQALAYFERSLAIYEVNFDVGYFGVERGREWVSRVSKLII